VPLALALHATGPVPLALAVPLHWASGRARRPAQAPAPSMSREPEPRAGPLQVRVRTWKRRPLAGGSQGVASATRRSPAPHWHWSFTGHGQPARTQGTQQRVVECWALACNARTVPAKCERQIWLRIGAARCETRASCNVSTNGALSTLLHNLNELHWGTVVHC
jgi:hypothetical protein